MALRLFKAKNRVGSVLSRHFGSVSVEKLIAASRTFPVTSRVDLQTALEHLLSRCYPANLIGVHPEFSHETLSIAHLAGEGHYPILIGPLQHDEIDVGEALPSRCLKHGLWLANTAGLPFAVLITPAERYGRSRGVHLEITLTPGEAGLAISHEFLDAVENRISQPGAYR